VCKSVVCKEVCVCHVFYGEVCVCKGGVLRETNVIQQGKKSEKIPGEKRVRKSLGKKE
jgi:hypothetical protein